MHFQSFFMLIIAQPCFSPMSYVPWLKVPLWRRMVLAL
jgi:hypothetical protein